MSTGAFNASQISRIIVPIIRFLMPNISDSDVRMIHGIIRKLAHVAEYFVLGLLQFRAMKNEFSNQRTWKSVISSLFLIMLLAGGDEYHQSFVSTRTASVIDVGYDTLGGFLGLCILLIWNRVKREPSEPAAHLEHDETNADVNK